MSRFTRLRELHPFLEYELMIHHKVEADNLQPDIISWQRLFFIMVKDTDWENASAAEKESYVARTQKLVIPNPQTWEGEQMYREIRRNTDAYIGLESDEGRGNAVVAFAAPFPANDAEVNVRGANALLARMCTRWSEDFYWRKIKAIEFRRPWAEHRAPATPTGSFAYEVFFHFERRPGYEHLSPEDIKRETARIRAHGLPWSDGPIN